MATAHDVVSSASKLWAVCKCSCSQPFFPLDAQYFSFLQASKEWVIPAKPKPGRKPKKETNGLVNEEIEVHHFIFVPSAASILMRVNLPRATQPFEKTTTGKRLYTKNASLSSENTHSGKPNGLSENESSPSSPNSRLASKSTSRER